MTPVPSPPSTTPGPEHLPSSPIPTMPSPPSQPTLILRSSTPLPRSPSHRRGEKDSDSTSGPRTFVFSLQHRPRATRASVPKVRSGCITCKKRHVKCDEAKPACKRCLKSLNSCEGYASLSPNRSSWKNNSRAKSPASSQADTDRSPSATPSQGSEYPSPERETIINSIHDGNPIGDQWEERYFEQWLVLANNLGGSWFPTTLFSHTIPQLGLNQPAIRYAAIAVGALASAVSPSTVPSLSSGPPHQTESRQHYNNAVTYHGHALRLVRVGLQGDVSSDCALRAAVISCLLFACFEALHDSTEEALNHINHGLTIIDQFMYTPDTTYLSVSPALSTVSIGSEYYEQQESPSGSFVQPEGSPVPFVFDGEILELFRRLEYMSWCARWMQNRPPAPFSIQFLCPTGIQDLSSPFTDLLEARRSLDQVQHQTMRDLVYPESVPIGSRGPDSSRGALLSRWYWAFLSLFELACANREQPQGSMAYHQAIALMLQYHSSSVCLLLAASTHVDSDTNIDPRLGSGDNSEQVACHFKEILTLAPVLLEDQPLPPGTTATFTMDQGPMMGLSLVASRTTDKCMESEARRLLAWAQRKDTFWGATFSVEQ
ncbi:hypothetical protein QBC39DRAFT_295935 [Podospora conica]|nr:hypothetical protein QBC39DRAFT_295935 [Schizothecium conicum]